MSDSAKSKSGPREFELKLEFDPADLAAIEAHPLLAGLTVTRQALLSVYYDTDTAALHEARLALRVRRGSSGYVQTIKGEGPAEMFDRAEWEQAIAGPEPDLSVIAGTPLGPLLKGGEGERLRPLFQTHIERDLYHVESDGSEVEVAIDRGEIEAGKSRSPVHEVEIELKKGDPAAIFSVARRLAAGVRARLAVKTKAEGGYALAMGGAPEAEKAVKLDLDGGLTCREAFRAVGQSCLRQIVVNEPGIRTGDADSLHQMRIGLRRMRAAITAFDKMVGDQEKKRIKAELKWITNELGPARDLDVFEIDILKPLKASQGGDTRLAEARRAFDDARAKAYSSAIGAVCSDRFRYALLDLAGWIETGPWTRDGDLRERRAEKVAKHAARLMSRGRKRVREDGADLRALSAKKRHKLRIKAKNLRYAVEFFAGVFPGGENAKRRDAALASLKDLQDQLGALNDLAQRETLAAGGHELANHAPELLAPKEADVEELLDRAQKAYAEFAAVKSFWKQQ